MINGPTNSAVPERIAKPRDSVKKHRLWLWVHRKANSLNTLSQARPGKRPRGIHVRDCRSMTVCEMSKRWRWWSDRLCRIEKGASGHRFWRTLSLFKQSTQMCLPLVHVSCSTPQHTYHS